MKTFGKLILAALLMVPMAIAGGAQAGDVKLNMGGPLGTFTATGKGNYVGSKSLRGRGHSSKKSAAHRRALAKKKAAARARAAAKKKEAARRRAIAAKKAAAKKQMAAKKAAQRKAAARRQKQRDTAEANRLAASKARDGDTAEASNEDGEDTTVAKSTPIKASAIAGANTLLDEDADADNVSDSSEAIKDDDDSETTPVDLARADTPADDKSDAEANKSSVGTGECTKYVPSAGLTISVPCDEE